jgi:predicted transcriptional regulator
VNSVQPNSKPDLYVVARIISVLKEEGALKRTELATKTGVAYDRLSKYVDWMNHEGLLRIDEEGNVFLTKLGTEPTINWLNGFFNMLEN